MEDKKAWINKDFFINVMFWVVGAVPSGWLGSFCPFILSHYSHPYIKALVDGSLQAFIDRSLKQYDTDRYPVGIIGGFGNALKEILTPLLEKSGIRIRAYIPSPIEELVRYHA